MSINISRGYYLVMRPPVYSASMSFHRIFSSLQQQPHSEVLRQWRRHLPLIRPCYAVSNASTYQTISFMREHRIPMLCETVGQSNAVNEYSLTIENTRLNGTGIRVGNEYIARKECDILSPIGSTPIWVYTRISHDGVEHARKMFEHIWAHKYILKGIVFDIRNFTTSVRGSIPPSIYNYKVAIDYVFRNIVRPFEREFGILTPCIMIDGRRHITRIEHLHELRTCIDSVLSSSSSSSTANTTEFQLIVDDIFDSRI